MLAKRSGTFRTELPLILTFLTAAEQSILSCLALTCRKKGNVAYPFFFRPFHLPFDDVLKTCAGISCQNPSSFSRSAFFFSNCFCSASPF
jgi:hypothetical protein